MRSYQEDFMPFTKLTVPERDGWRELVNAWGAVLDQWEHLCSESSKPYDYDVAYWHCEDSITASLSTAAWRSGGAGLVQFDTERRRMIRQQPGGGWGDAWLRVGANWYTLEAKLCWYGDEVKERIEAARTQLRMLPQEDRAGAGAILCYCVPEIPGEPKAGLLDTLAADLEREFPRVDVLLEYKPISTHVPAHNGKMYPGMVVVGEILNWERL
jgi:hypothetical protein